MGYQTIYGPCGNGRWTRVTSSLPKENGLKGVFERATVGIGNKNRPATVILRCDPGLLNRGSLEGWRAPTYPHSLPMGAFVYILLCADRSYYVGTATGDDLAPRIAQHNSGFYGGYTSTRRPVQLAWSQHFEQITDAIAAERQLKGWSRAKKEALIRSDWNLVQRLAKRRAGKPKDPL